MPVGAGIMQIGLVTVYETTAQIDNITPDPAYCGDALTFDVTITNNTVGGPYPIGDFSIVDRLTDNVLATGTITFRGSGTAICPAAVGYLELFVRYDGYYNQFLPSESSITEFGLSLVASTTTIISPLPGDYYCAAQNSPITAYVSAGRGSVTGGNVNFRLYTSATEYVDLPSATVDAFGNAESIIPAETTLPSRSNYLQASFDGYQCYTRSSSARGTSGTLIYPTQNDNTTLVLSVDGGTTFNASNPVTFIGTVTGTNLPDPSDGYVHFYAADGYTIDLGNATPESGVASIVVPGNTFDPRGTWDLYGQYYSDTVCYDNSALVNIRINPT